MDGRVDLWVVDLEGVAEAEVQARYRELLDGPERARYERITHRGVKGQYLITRALVRTTLSTYEPTAPQAWRFTANEHGCPRVDTAATGSDTDLVFNVSHTDGAIVMAVARGRAVGVDVEDSERSSDTSKIAHRFFAEPEVEALRALPAEDQRGRFFTYWTLKEAYIKARGMGLAIPLGRFWFDVDAPPTIGFDTDRSLSDPPGRWWFATAALSPRHQLALAVDLGAGASVVVRAHEGVPLVGMAPRPLAVTRCSGELLPG